LAAVVRRAFVVRFREGFTLGEAAPYGLLDPGGHRDERTVVSRRRLRPLQNALNPAEFSLLTEDKAVFYSYCEGLRLPTPKLYGLFFRNAAGWAGGRSTQGRAEWCSFVADQLPDEFVLKPARSSFGIGVEILSRDGDGFVGVNGRAWSVEQLYDELAHYSRFDAFVLQERISAHLALEKMSGLPTLQCLRMNTLVAGREQPQIQFAELKVAVVGGVVDNIHLGHTGNLTAEVSLADGRLGPGVRGSLEKLSMVSFRTHPTTDAQIAGIEVPHWDEACELVREAALRFLPLRSLGWDVGISPAGPILVEANMWWGPSNGHVGLGTMLTTLQKTTADLPRGAPGRKKTRSRHFRRLWALASLRRLIRVVREVRSAARFYRTSFSSTFGRAMLVRRKRGFPLAEAANLGLLDSRLTAVGIDEHLSRATTRPLQDRLNSSSLAPLTEDKTVFYRVCEELEIPTPKLHALFFRNRAGWTPDGSILASREEWCRFFSEGPDEDFVVKPANGHWGEEVGIYRRLDGRLADSHGSPLGPDDLYDVMQRHERFSNWVVQERLRNHPDVLRLSGTETIQCARMITLVAASGKPELVWAHFRAVAGDALYDNFRVGERGSLRVEIARGDGRLGRAVGLAPEGMGLTEVEIHPKTGVAFAGFRLPFWPQACGLVEEAASRLVPLQTLGWDVAFTPTGPVIIEANSAWGPPNGLGGMPLLLRMLRERALRTD
jgi:hypothetical protein